MSKDVILGFGAMRLPLTEKIMIQKLMMKNSQK